MNKKEIREAVAVAIFDMAATFMEDGSRRKSPFQSWPEQHPKRKAAYRKVGDAASEAYEKAMKEE